MGAQTEALKTRTRRFALDVLALVAALPAGEPGATIRRQLARSAMSVDVNYRASCRSRSRAEFIAKIGQVAEEADESANWLEMLSGAHIVPSDSLQKLRQEAQERVAMFSASVGTARRNRARRSGS